MNSLVIAGTNIRRDAEGRYSLNDLHVAAGGENRHQPAFFMKRPETVELIEAISNSSPEKNWNPVEAGAGRYGGTWVAEQLVVAYAGWISAAFHLEVINTFIAAKKATVRKAGEYGIAAPVAREYRALLTIAKLSGLKGNQATIAAAQGAEKLTGTNPLALIGQVQLIAAEQVRHYTPTELGKEMGESGQAFNRRLEKAGLQVKNIHGQWQPTDAGKPFGVLQDTGKKHGNGTPIQQWKWLHTVLDHLTDPEAA